MRIVKCQYSNMWVDKDEECICHQCSGDTPQCKYHYASVETFRGVNFGNEHQPPIRIVSNNEKGLE
jgi:hypothetical protein